MTTITRESVEIKSFITGFLSDAAHDNQSSNSLLANVFRIALASLEAEPVAWMRDDADGREYNARNEFSGGGGGVPLYATPQVLIVTKAEPIAVSDDMAYAFHHALSDSSLGADEVEEIKTGLRAAFSNVAVQPTLIVPNEIEPDDSNTFDYVDGWNACRAAMLHSAEPVSQAYKLNALAGKSPVTPGDWISCSELMPEDGQYVIILCDGAFVLYAQYRDGEFFDVVRNGEEFFETQSRNVTDWMPLPEPPRRR